jgi:hypothetical protein
LGAIASNTISTLASIRNDLVRIGCATVHPMAYSDHRSPRRGHEPRWRGLLIGGFNSRSSQPDVHFSLNARQQRRFRPKHSHVACRITQEGSNQTSSGATLSPACTNVESVHGLSPCSSVHMHVCEKALSALRRLNRVSPLGLFRERERKRGSLRT